MSKTKAPDDDPPALKPFLAGLTPIQARIVRASYATRRDADEEVTEATALRRWKKHIAPFIAESRAANAKRIAKQAAKAEREGAGKGRT
jgi:hypothetical protein